MSVYLWAKNTIAVFQHRRLLMYWICQRIPSDQVQFSSTALISSAHQGFSVPPPLSPLCSHTLFLPPAFPFHCHPLANLAHTIAPNHNWQFKLALFSLSLALQNTSQQNGPCASAAPRLLDPIYLRARICVCVCFILPECYAENKKRGTKKEQPSNDRATLIRLSKAIIAEFQRYSV